MDLYISNCNSNIWMESGIIISSTVLVVFWLTKMYSLYVQNQTQRGWLTDSPKDHLLIIFIISFFSPRQQWLRELASILHYTFNACLTLKKTGGLLQMFFNYALEYVIRRVAVNQDGLKLNSTHQLLVDASFLTFQCFDWLAAFHLELL